MCGVQVWEDVPKDEKDNINRAIRQLVEMCGDRGSFKSEDEWLVRSRACTETVAVFVFFMNGNIATIRNLGELLSDVAGYGRTHVAEMSHNESFATRWTCLSLLSIKQMLNSTQLDALNPLEKLVAFHPQGGSGFTETARRNAQTIDKQFAAACSHIERLQHAREGFDLAGGGDRTRERITEILRQNESELLPILDKVERMEELKMDASLSEVQLQIHKVTYDLIRKLPGVAFDDDNITGPTAVEQALDFLANPVQPQFIYFSRLLRGLCSVNQKWSSEEPVEIDSVMRSIVASPRSLS